MEKPLISVIVPVYNVATFLVRCLDSLAKQTYTNIEFLLVDDGSTDNSGEICRRYAADDRRFRYLHQQNAGVSAARNLGLQEAKGEYLGFCDSDDWVDPDLYETLLALCIANQADISIVTCAVEEAEGTVPFEDSEEIFRMCGTEALVEMHKAQKFAGQMWNKLIKRQLLQGKRFSQDIAIYEDILLLSEVFREAERVVYQKKHKYHYVIHPQSALNRSMNEKHWTVQPACRILVEHMDCCNPDNREWAVYTLLLANVHLLNKLYEGKVLNEKNFEKVMAEIRLYDTQTARALLPKGYRYQISAAKCGRLCYLCYYAMIRASWAQKVKAAVRGMLARKGEGV